MSLALAAPLALALLALMVLFSLCEAVVVHVGVARAAALLDEGKGRAQALVQLLSRREEALVSVVAARFAAQAGMVGAAVAVGIDAGIGGWTWLGLSALVIIVLSFTETTAKALALVRADQVSLAVAPVGLIVSRLPLLGRTGRQLVRLARRGTPGDLDEQPIHNVSEEELLAFADVAAEADVIEASERLFIASIIEFGDTIVREVMVPRPDMITVAADWRVADVMEVVILNGLSRIPVTGENIDDVVGIVYAKDLMRAERDGREDEPVSAVSRSARFVPEQKRVAELLREMQLEKFHMAVVVDEYGGVAGLVTLEDLIEELVGEIVDEYDVEEPMAEPLPGGAYRVNARMPVDEVNELMGASLPEGDWDTVGGLLFSTFGRVPNAGESVDIDGYRVTAVRVQGRRIGLVRIERVATSSAGGADVAAEAEVHVASPAPGAVAPSEAGR